MVRRLLVKVSVLDQRWVVVLGKVRRRGRLFVRLKLTLRRPGRPGNVGVKRKSPLIICRVWMGR